MSFVSHQAPNGLEYFIKADQAEGLTVLVPGKGIFKLDADAAKKLVNFPHQFEFLAALSAYRKAANGAGKPVHTHIENETEKTISVFDFMIMDTAGHNVAANVKMVSTENADVVSELEVTPKTMSAIVYELAKAGIKSTVKQYAGVVSVDTLPSETAFSKLAFYHVKEDGKIYKLNDAEDGFEEVTDPIVEVEELPATEITAKQNVLYFLNHPTKKADRGFFEYNGTSFIKADYVGVKEIARLPKEEDIEDHLIYVVTKDIKQKDKPEVKAGTIYVGKEQALEEKTLTIEEVSELPNLVVAKEGTIYGVNGVYRKFTAGEFGPIIAKAVNQLDVKPDFEKVGLTVDADVIYVLNKQVDEQHLVGSKWVFDTATKAFKAYDPEEAAPAEATTAAAPAHGAVPGAAATGEHA